MPASPLHRAWMASHWREKEKATFECDFFPLACDGEFCHNRAINTPNILMKKDETKNELEINLNTYFNT